MERTSFTTRPDPWDACPRGSWSMLQGKGEDPGALSSCLFAARVNVNAWS